MTSAVNFFGDSDIGRVRRVNEDSFRLIPERGTIVVCDGMGGHAAGEIASQRAVETVAAYLQRPHGQIEAPALNDMAGRLLPEAVDLVWAVRLANRRVFQTAQAQKQTRGMGTTLVAARFLEGRAIVCHVGDSRAYLFREGRLLPITVDHSLVAELLAQNEITAEQARTFPDRNIITRALGTRPVVAVDVTTIPLSTGDLFLLCSDGLCGAVDDHQMQSILQRHHKNPTEAIAGLIEAANEAGGHDNITVAIGQVRETVSPDGRKESMTVPESDNDLADIEESLLDALFTARTPAEKPDVDTDKIAIHPPQS